MLFVLLIQNSPTRYAMPGYEWNDVFLLAFSPFGDGRLGAVNL